MVGACFVLSLAVGKTFNVSSLSWLPRQQRRIAAARTRWNRLTLSSLRVQRMASSSIRRDTGESPQLAMSASSGRMFVGSSRNVSVSLKPGEGSPHGELSGPLLLTLPVTLRYRSMRLALVDAEESPVGEIAGSLAVASAAAALVWRMPLMRSRKAQNALNEASTQKGKLDDDAPCAIADALEATIFSSAERTGAGSADIELPSCGLHPIIAFNLMFCGSILDGSPVGVARTTSSADFVSCSIRFLAPLYTLSARRTLRSTSAVKSTGAWETANRSKCRNIATAASIRPTCKRNDKVHNAPAQSWNWLSLIYLCKRRRGSVEISIGLTGCEGSSGTARPTVARISSVDHGFSLGSLRRPAGGETTSAVDVRCTRTRSKYAPPPSRTAPGSYSTTERHHAQINGGEPTLCRNCRQARSVLIKNPHGRSVYLTRHAHAVSHGKTGGWASDPLDCGGCELCPRSREQLACTCYVSEGVG